MATSSPLEITLLWSKGYDVIIPTDDVTNKILSSDSNYMVEMFIWPKFGNSSISMRKVNTTLVLLGFWPEKLLFLRGGLRSSYIFWYQGANLKFHTSVEKLLKLKVRGFWGQIPTFPEDTGQKLAGRGPFGHPLPLLILNRVSFKLFPAWQYFQ